jgi:hypothetical protein
MKYFILFIILLDTLCSEASWFDMNLDEKGGHLYQTQPQENESFYLLKYTFPSATSTKIDPGTGKISPSLSSTNGISPNGKYKLFATVGQITTGSSEDTANFRLKMGFFTSSRKSRFIRKGVRSKRKTSVVRRKY